MNKQTSTTRVRVTGLLLIVLIMTFGGFVLAAVPQSTIRTTGGGITTYVGHYVNATLGYSMGGVEIIDNTRAATFVTLDTGQGANELYDMDQNVLQASAVVFATVDTGQGANELYDMDQDVLVASNVNFSSVEADEYYLSSVNITDYILNANPAGTSTFVGLLLDLTQDYLFTDNAGSNGIALQSQNAAGSSSFDLFTKDGDGTDVNSINIYGLGTPGAIADRERIIISYNPSGQFEISIEENGAGVNRPLVLFTEGNTDQLKLLIDGNLFTAGTNQFQFRDGTTYINSGSAGKLNLAGTIISLDSGTIRMSSKLEHDGDADTFMLYEADSIKLTAGNVELIHITGTNNTGTVGLDGTRIADGYFTTITAKNTVTGKIIETEISANPGESFEEGDLVQILDGDYFTKTTKKLANVIGVVTLNPGNIVTGYEDVSTTVDGYFEDSPVTYEYTWNEIVTDADGVSYEVERSETRNEYEYYLEEVTETLSSGDPVTYNLNLTRVKTEQVWVSPETTISSEPVYGPKNDPVVCVFGRAKVKISEPVLMNDVLVSSGDDGYARPLRTVLPELLSQYGGMQMDLENVLMIVEKLNYKILGRVMEDSSSDTCWALIGY